MVRFCRTFKGLEGTTQILLVLHVNSERFQQCILDLEKFTFIKLVKKFIIRENKNKNSQKTIVFDSPHY